MKVSIGIRANPNQINYCVLSGTIDEFEIKIIDKIVNPKSLDVPEQLKFLRSTLGDIINENKVSNACIRITESNAQTVNVRRIYIEGVIQELIASSTIERYYVGQISSISAKIGIAREEFKPFAAGEAIFLGIDTWNELSSEERECVMAAFSALNL